MFPERPPIFDVRAPLRSLSFLPLIALALVGLSTLSTPRAVSAAEPSTPAEAPAQRDTSDTATPAGESPHRSGGSMGEGQIYWWFYVSGLLLAAMIPAGYVLYRRYGEADAADWDRAEFSPPASRERAPAREGEQAASEALFGRRDEASPLYADDAVQTQPPESTPTFSDGEPEQARRICPECGERFSPSTVVCPHDATPLQDRAERNRSPGEWSDGSPLARRRCPGCGRRYEAGTTYCYHDGIRLVDDTIEAAEEAPTYKVCETCGLELETDDALCPNDGTELLDVAPGADPSPPPTVPYAMCPECGQKAPPGETHCTDDGNVLTPICHTHVEHLSSNGFGPRRKICRECGETYSSAASYCSQDGTELLPMN